MNNIDFDHCSILCIQGKTIHQWTDLARWMWLQLWMYWSSHWTLQVYWKVYLLDNLLEFLNKFSDLHCDWNLFFFLQVPIFPCSAQLLHGTKSDRQLLPCSVLSTPHPTHHSSASWEHYPCWYHSCAKPRLHFGSTPAGHHSTHHPNSSAWRSALVKRVVKFLRYTLE